LVLQIPDSGPAPALKPVGMTEGKTRPRHIPLSARWLGRGSSRGAQRGAANAQNFAGKVTSSHWSGLITARPDAPYLPTDSILSGRRHHRYRHASPPVCIVRPLALYNPSGYRFVACCLCLATRLPLESRMPISGRGHSHHPFPDHHHIAGCA